MARKPKPTSKPKAPKAPKADHECTGKACVYCLQRRDMERINVGDSVTERTAQGGGDKRVGVVLKAEQRKGKNQLQVRFKDETQREAPADQFVRTGAVKILDTKIKVPRDLSVYQVFRDVHGIAYLRVETTKIGAKFVVNKGFQVELVELDGGSCRVLDLRPVVGSSIYECGKRLLQPLNDQVTISMRAKSHLEQILQNEELKNMATTKTKATKTAKFATVTAPAAKNGKKVASANGKPAKAAKAAKAKGEGNGAGRLDDKIIKVKIKENPLRDGTFCHAQVKAFMQSDGKAVSSAQTKLNASGLNPNDRRIEVAWAVKKGYITVHDAK